MNDVERLLLTETTKDTQQLFKDRNDMLIGFAAVVLDLYRQQFKEPNDKSAAISRLKIQLAQLESISGKPGATALSWLISNLENDKLNAAAWLSEPVRGNA